MKEPIDKFKQKLELKKLDEESAGFKKIHCPSCNTETPASAINIQDKIAKCNSCNVVFSLEEKISSLLHKNRIRQEVIRPEGIDLFHFKGDLDITLQQPANVLDVILVFILPFIAIITTLLYFFPKNGGNGPPELVPIIFWLLSLYPIINIFNMKKAKIHVLIEDETLSILHRPKKFIKDKHIDTREIDQLYVKKINHLYSISMIVNGFNGQKHMTIINGLDSISKARYLEQEIERHLGIEDRAVPDEIK